MEEDMILPDGFEGLPADEPVTEPQNEPVEDLDTKVVDEPTRESAEPVEAEQEPTTEPQKIRVKVDREEREISVEEAAILAQKGMNYERAIERARQEAAQQARDQAFADMGHIWNGKPITTEAEYKQALAEQELINKYRDRDLPEEVIQELLESRRDREERQKEKQANEAESKNQAQIDEFLEYFQSVNERPFDPKQDVFPDEVKQAIAKGQTPKYAYMEYHNKELRNRLKIAKQNESNTKKAPVGSVTTGGGVKTEPEDAFLAGFNSIK